MVLTCGQDTFPTWQACSLTRVVRVDDSEDGLQVGVVPVHGLQDAVVRPLLVGGKKRDTLLFGVSPPSREKDFSAADLWSGLADGELPHPLLVVHHALLGVTHQLGAQYPPGQPQVQCSLGGAGPVLQRDHTCDSRINQVSKHKHNVCVCVYVNCCDYSKKVT